MSDPITTNSSLFNIGALESSNNLSIENDKVKGGPKAVLSPKIQTVAKESFQQLTFETNGEDMGMGQHEVSKKEEMSGKLKEVADKLAKQVEDTPDQIEDISGKANSSDSGETSDDIEEDLFGDESELALEFDSKDSQDVISIEKTAENEEEEIVSQSKEMNVIEELGLQAEERVFQNEERAVQVEEEVSSFNETAAAHHNDLLVYHNANKVNRDKPDLSQLKKRINEEAVEIASTKEALANGIPIDIAVKPKGVSIPSDVEEIREATNKGNVLATKSAAILVTQAAIEQFSSLATSLNANIDKDKVYKIAHREVMKHISKEGKLHLPEEELEKIFNAILDASRISGAIFKLDSNGNKISLNDEEWEILKKKFKESFMNTLREHGLVIIDEEDGKKKNVKEKDSHSRNYEMVTDRNKSRKLEEQSPQSQINERINVEQRLREQIKSLRMLSELNEEGIKKARKIDELYKEGLKQIKDEDSLKKKDGEVHIEKVDRVLKEEGFKVENTANDVKVKTTVEIFDPHNPKGISSELAVRIKTIYNTSVLRG